MMGTARMLATGVLLLALLPAAAGDRSTLPPLEVQVLYDAGGGPDRFRVDFRDSLLQALRARGCFPSVVQEAGEDTVLLRVVLEAPLVESRDSLSIHGSLRNREERGASSTTSSVQVHADLELLLPAGRDLFRGKSIRCEASYRPTFAWEDGSGEARERLIQELSSRVVAFACKARGRKLLARIRE